MQTTVVNTFNDKTNERVYSRYYVGDNQVSFEEYAKLMDDMYSDDGRDDNNTDIENGNMDEFAIHPCQCDYCKLTDEERAEIELVENYAEHIESIKCTCGCELRNFLYSLVQNCMSNGYEHARSKMKEFLD